MSRLAFARTATTQRGERGAAAVEFALVLPLLVVLVFGIVEFSIAYNHKQGLHAAAREGARLAALPQSSESDVADKVRDALDGVLNTTEINAATITITPDKTHPCDGAAPGTHVVVTVSAPDALDVPFVTNSTVTLTGKGEFLCE
jgi:Flp pilus assembly protein TadG